jgi:hypothetical protein
MEITMDWVPEDRDSGLLCGLDISLASLGHILPRFIRFSAGTERKS